MALLEKSRERLAELFAQATKSTDSLVAESAEFSQLAQNPAAIGENLESDELDLLLTRSLNNLERRRSDSEAQILEINAINDALDRICGKKQAPS